MAESRWLRCSLFHSLPLGRERYCVCPEKMGELLLSKDFKKEKAIAMRLFSISKPSRKLAR
jgi:hypothetical protein